MDQNRILVQRRPEEGLLGGLWELPGSEVLNGETAEQAMLRTVQEGLGLQVVEVQALSTVHHAYSHFKVTLYPFLCRWQQGEAVSADGRLTSWEEPHGLSSLPMPVSVLRVLEEARLFFKECRNVLANPDR